jgi:hypothetical protein
VHFQLGVSPDLGRNRLSVVPQVPAGQPSVAGRHVRLGTGSVDIRAGRTAHRLTTVVHRDRPWRLTVGAVLPRGGTVGSVRLDGHPASYDVVPTARGREVLVRAGSGTGTTRLVVTRR